MLKQSVYQSDYEGEFIITQSTIKQGQKHETREWVPNTVENSQHFGVAYAIGNGASRLSINLKWLHKPHGRLFGHEMGQTYGCNAVHRDFEPQFLIVNNQIIINELVQKQQELTSTVFANTSMILDNPGFMHLIPYNFRSNAGTMALYLACFHEHNKIYMLGYDNIPRDGAESNVYQDTDGYTQSKPSGKWVKNVENIMKMYPNTEFVRVETLQQPPESWLWCSNFRQISHKDFISEQNLG